MHISSSILSECSGDCLRNSPPDSVFDQIAAALIAPGNFAQLPTSSADSGSLAHSPPHRQGTTCASENPDALWLYSHPDNQ